MAAIAYWKLSVACKIKQLALIFNIFLAPQVQLLGTGVVL